MIVLNNSLSKDIENNFILLNENKIMGRVAGSVKLFSYREAEAKPQNAGQNLEGCQ